MYVAYLEVMNISFTRHFILIDFRYTILQIVVRRQHASGNSIVIESGAIINNTEQSQSAFYNLRPPDLDRIPDGRLLSISTTFFWYTKINKIFLLHCC